MSLSRTMPSNQKRWPRHARSGFTLIEMAIALTLLATVFIGLNRFALGGLQSASTNIEIADLRRQAAYTRNLLAEDLAQARACDPSGYGSPLLLLDSANDVKRFALYTTATANSRPELVEWRFYPSGDAFRISTIVSLEANLCDASINLPVGYGQPGEPASMERAIEEVETQSGEYPQLEVLAAGRNMFAVELIGTHNVVQTSGETLKVTKSSSALCVGWAQVDCYIDLLEIRLVLVTSGFEPIETRIQWSFAVNLENAKL